MVEHDAHHLVCFELIRMAVLKRPRIASSLLALCIGATPWIASGSDTSDSPHTDWREASEHGDYDEAVALALSDEPNSPLSQLIHKADELQLSDTSQWRAFLHYKPAYGGRWLSQVDSPHFFMSTTGKQSPTAELHATLAAFYATQAKAPLRLSAYCRFVARRFWLTEQVPALATLIPVQPCPEFERYVEYLDADVLTLIFPTAHPNSPSSAFGHTLLRIDKKDQQPESRLLNMSINFAAEVPPEVSSTAYAIRGLGGGFPGKFRLLPYHMKLREYGQIENRDTWEYPLSLDKPAVDLVLRHAYEMLISHFDYFFFSENCSYHLLSLLEVAYPDNPLTDHFDLWTIPVDTIRLLEEKNLVADAQFVPSSIRALRARRDQLPQEDGALALAALEQGLEHIDPELNSLSTDRQAGILDLLSDYERYERLKTDPSALGSSTRERAILSRRSKLGVRTAPADVTAPASTPDSGHGTSRVSLQYHQIQDDANSVEVQFRPAYHDFRDPSAAFDDKAAIELGLIGIAQDLDSDKAFLRRFTLVSIESIEPRGAFFKPISWHTNLKWERPRLGARHEFTFNVGAGVAFQYSPASPVVFVFGESDLVDAPAFAKRRQLRLGASAGAHWEPVSRVRTGLEFDFRRQVGGAYYESQAEAWLGVALAEHWSFNLDLVYLKTHDQPARSRTSAGIRYYF